MLKKYGDQRFKEPHWISHRSVPQNDRAFASLRIATQSAEYTTCAKNSPLKKLLPHVASRSANGLLAAISSADLPAVFSFARDRGIHGTWSDRLCCPAGLRHRSTRFEIQYESRQAGSAPKLSEEHPSGICCSAKVLEAALRDGFEFHCASIESTVTTAIGVVAVKSSMRRGTCFRSHRANLELTTLVPPRSSRAAARPNRTSRPGRMSDDCWRRLPHARPE
jgi:hypothetical protein